MMRKRRGWIKIFDFAQQFYYPHNPQHQDRIMILLSLARNFVTHLKRYFIPSVDGRERGYTPHLSPL